MPGRKVSTTIYITAEQNRRIKLLSHAKGVSMAEIIREGIDMVLDKWRDHLPVQLGLGIGEPPGGGPTQ